MNNSKKITSYHSLKVIIEKYPGEELISHLKKTVLGTPGGLRYRHTQQERKLLNIGDVYFILLYKGKHLVGSVGLCQRDAYKGNSIEKAWYIRYFSIVAPLRDKKGHSRKRKGKRDGLMGILKNAVIPYFENPDLLQQKKDVPASKSIIFSHIEKGNPRSLNFSEQMGFERVRKMSTMIYSRFNPKKMEHVKEITEDNKPFVLKKIRDFYADYTMFQEQYIFYNNNYYLAYENGEIVAGLQANPEEWQIIEMGGFGGILLNLLHKLPVLRKWIDPQSFRFLAVEGIWYKKGKASYIADIIESALYTTKHHIALTWQDSDSPLRKELLRAGKMGILSRFLKTGDGEVMVKFVSFNEDERKDYTDKPAYLCGYDMT